MTLVIVRVSKFYRLDDIFVHPYTFLLFARVRIKNLSSFPNSLLPSFVLVCGITTFIHLCVAKMDDTFDLRFCIILIKS